MRTIGRDGFRPRSRPGVVFVRSPQREPGSTCSDSEKNEREPKSGEFHFHKDQRKRARGVRRGEKRKGRGNKVRLEAKVKPEHEVLLAYSLILVPRRWRIQNVCESWEF
jgi:hypothetical protein